MRTITSYISADDWVSKDAFDRILYATMRTAQERGGKLGIDKLEDIEDSVVYRALRMLNETVTVSLQSQFRQALGLDEAAFRNDAAAALRHFDRIDKLRAFGFDHATIDPTLREQLRRVVEAVDGGEPRQAYRGKNLWEAQFYPEALGLYWAIFQEEPRASWNADTGKGPSAAFMFIQKIFIEIESSGNSEGLFEAAKRAELDLPDWDYHSELALRNKMNAWKKRPGTESAEPKKWIQNGHFYRRYLTSGPVKLAF